MRTLLALLLICAACSSKPKMPDATSAALIAPVVDEASIDKSADPCDDFYQYACGGWLKNTPIPKEQPAWGRSFSEIEKRNEERVRALLEDAAAGKSTDPDAQKLGDLYATCMDEAKAETDSPKALKLQLARIDGIRTLPDLAREVARLHLESVNVFFNFSSGQDAKDATQMIGQASQAGLGLPDKEYYLSEDADKASKRALYVEYVAKVLQLMGAAPEAASAQAQRVLAIETELAKGSMSRVDLRDPQKTYHRLDRAGLQGLVKDFPLDAYFQTIEHEGIQAINVVAPDFFAGLNKLITSAKGEDLKTYLRWHAIAAAVPALGKAFVEERFKFVSKAYTGSEEDLPRWKKCVAFTTSAMGQSVGRMFVEGNFGAEGKELSLDMIRRIEEQFELNLGGLAWMDGATKAQAVEKLHKIANEIGYPDKWRDYSALEPDRSSYLANSLRAARYTNHYDWQKIGKPVDRHEWDWPPSIVNAGYDAQFNRMTFPAGILQAPFFDKGFSPAQNFGAIGYVMGHELTHGFDDEGRQYDGLGNLRDWWTPDATKAYTERAQCVRQQYDNFTVLDGKHVNGQLTLGENIADIGGIKMSLRAFRKLREGKPDEKVMGYTADQRFFLAAAQVWCEKQRPQFTALLVTIDPHSPAQYRVNGPFSDTPDFAGAFQCKAGSKMAPEKRCEVW